MPVATAVERLSAGIEREGTLGLGNMDVDQQVRPHHAHPGSLALALHEVVGNGILHAVGHELGVAELVAEDDFIHRKRLSRTHVILPLDGLDLFIHLIGVGGRKVADGFQDANGGTQAEVGLVQHPFITRKGHHASAFLYIIGSQFSQFLS